MSLPLDTFSPPHPSELSLRLNRPSPAPTASSSSSYTLSSISSSPELQRCRFSTSDDQDDPFTAGKLPRHNHAIRRDSGSALWADDSWQLTRPAVSSWNATIAEATHDALISNRNFDYMKLLDAHDILKTRLQDARLAYDQLNVRYDTLQTCYTTLVNTVGDHLSTAPVTTPASAITSNALPPALSTSVDHLQLLERKDYPLVTYWTEGEFLAAEKKRKDEKGKAGMADPQSKRGAQRLVQDDENVVYWFIEDKDGNPVGGRRAKSMRDEARRIWNSLGKKGQTPERWGDADLVVRSYYAGEMRRFFPELHLCELDYKSHRIAINIYPAWHAKWVAETSPPALKRSASQAPEGEPAKKYRGRKKANQSSSADDLLPPADQTSALSASGVPTSSSLSALSSAPPQVLAPTPVSIAPSPSVISAPQPSHSSLPPPAPPLVSPPQSSVVPSPTVDLSAVTVAVKKNIPIQMEVDNDLPIVPASSPSTSTLAATAAGPSTSAPATTAVGAGPAVGVVDNPLAFLGDTTAPTTRADFIADVAKTKAGKSKKDAKADQVKYVRPNKTKSARNLCLIDYMEKNNIPLPGKVQSDVFDQYYSGLTKDQKKAWADKSKEEKKDKTKDT